MPSAHAQRHRCVPPFTQFFVGIYRAKRSSDALPPTLSGCCARSSGRLIPARNASCIPPSVRSRARVERGQDNTVGEDRCPRRSVHVEWTNGPPVQVTPPLTRRGNGGCTRRLHPRPDCSARSRQPCSGDVPANRDRATAPSMSRPMRVRDVFHGAPKRLPGTSSKAQRIQRRSSPCRCHQPGA